MWVMRCVCVPAECDAVYIWIDKRPILVPRAAVASVSRHVTISGRLVFTPNRKWYREPLRYMAGSTRVMPVTHFYVQHLLNISISICWCVSIIGLTRLVGEIQHVLRSRSPQKQISISCPSYGSIDPFLSLIEVLQTMDIYFSSEYFQPKFPCSCLESSLW